MPGADTGDVCRSFERLQRIQRSFDELGTLGPRQERTLLRLVRQLGPTVLPLCVRVLRSPGTDPGVDDERARWACALLEHLAGLAAHRQRVVDTLEALARDSGASGPARLRTLALLSDLERGAAERTEASARAERPARELWSLLATAPDVAHAADILVARVEPAGMLAVVGALAARAQRSARRLVDELLLRNDIDEPSRAELRRLAGPRGARGPRRVVAGAPVATAQVAMHASGRRAVVVSRRRGNTPGGPHRALCLILDADGTLLEGVYRDDVAAGSVHAELFQPLGSVGYRFETLPCADAVRLVVRAARASWQLGRPLPRAFYLGRDLLGIHDEHVVGMVAEDDPALLLEHARDLLFAGQAEHARSLLERHVTLAPDSVDGSASLALCLMVLGDDSGARAHLRRAAWLEPKNPNHHWNLAAIAHRQGRPAGCYIELLDYLELADVIAGTFDDAPGNIEERRAVALRFVAEYERIARIEFPDASPAAVAHADDLVFRARQLARTGEHDAALAVLEQALCAVADHYPALTLMGTLHMEQGRSREAEPLLVRALAVRPGHAPAAEALQRLQSLAAMAPRRTRTRRRSPGAAGAEKSRAR